MPLQLAAPTGEGHGTITMHDNYMVVYQTRQGHERIRKLPLKEPSPQPGRTGFSIETRFLVINNNFLEDIGVDLDVYLNLNNRRLRSVPATPARWVSRNSSSVPPAAITGPPSRSTRIPPRPGPRRLARVFPARWAAGAVPNAFNVSGSFLDNIQVDFLIRATQANRRSRQLTAPHVTVISGEEATADFKTKRSYVQRFHRSGHRPASIRHFGHHGPHPDDPWQLRTPALR